MKLKIGLGPICQNYEEFDRWEAQERGEEVGPPTVEDSEIWAEHLALCDLAEPLGFDTFWTLEHRTSPYILLPSPMQFLAYMAGRTGGIDLGTFVVVVPWHDPMRLAEEVSVLQHMMGRGRSLRLGIGRGLARREYAAMGIAMDESRGRFREGLEVLREGLRNERFSYEGEHYSYDNTAVRPRPLDPEIVYDIYGAWGSPPSIPVAAELGLNAMVPFIRPLADVKNELAEYTRCRRDAGHPPARKPILQTFMYCSESEQEAHEAAERYYFEYADSVIRHYEMGGSHFKQAKGYEFYGQAQEGSSGGTMAALTGTLDEGSTITDQRNKMATEFGKLILDEAIWGTPAQCIEKIAAVNEFVGPSELVIEPANGSMRGEEAERNTRLFAEKVLPEAQRMESRDVSYE